MFIDVVRPESWEELNDQVKTFLGLEARLRVRSYQGIAQAVFEISQGTAQFMSHKKSIGVILGQTSVFESLLPYYYKETYEVHTLSHLKLTNVKEWVESLKKDTNFVLFSEDHPVTGELYPFAEELDKLLNEKRIFSFRVSHSQHFYEPSQLRPYTVRLCSFNPTAAVAVLGERFRSPSLLAQNMTWDQVHFLMELTDARASRVANPLLVEKFEQEISSVATPYFKAGAPRLFDRAVCVFNDVSAEALAEVLFKKMGLSSEQGWSKLSSTNMCHWSVVKMFRHWWEPAPSLEELRGMLIVGPELLNTKDFAKLLISSYEEVRALQNWTV
ncbi:hypothetical protein [Bdellovibrio sp. HCB-110]|uniref:hypothetical protein n=1 Tax=Bdellovibrio sp. HCB-110 TaxID=3391182 RepID=UPI0039B5063E